MSPKIPTTPRSAEPSCGRIELVPSRRIARCCHTWLILLCVVTGWGVVLPVPVRVAMMVGFAACVLAGVECSVKFRWPDAALAIEWTHAGELHLLTTGGRLQARLMPGSFRLGVSLLALRLQTSAGTRCLLIDGPVQDHRAFRRLLRVFAVSLRAASGRLPARC